MKVKVLLVILIVLISLPLWSGGQQTKGMVIKFLHRYPEEPYTSFIDEKIVEFETANPGVKLDVQSVSYENYHTRLKVVMSSDERPDIFMAYCGEFLNMFVRQDMVYDLTDKVEGNASWKNSLNMALIRPYYFRDRLYGLPFRVDAKAFFYNKDIYAKNGVKVPNTWDELIDICEGFKSRNLTPIAFGNKGPWAALHYVGTLFQKIVDPEVLKKDYNPETGEFTDPDYVKAFNYYMRLMDYVNPTPNAVEHGMARQNWINGKSAMVFLESIEIPMVDPAAPEGFRYGLFAFPSIPEGKGDQNVITGAPEGFAVLKATKYPEQTIAFLRFITGPEVGKEEVEVCRWFNASKGIVDAAYPHEGIAEAYKMLTSASGMANWLDTEVDPELANAFLTGVQRLTGKEISPAQLMTEIEAKAEEVRKKF
jgi:raffinose/stachyose/melibiose transport system substrate-binding protein